MSAYHPVNIIVSALCLQFCRHFADTYTTHIDRVAVSRSMKPSRKASSARRQNVGKSADEMPTEKRIRIRREEEEKTEAEYEEGTQEKSQSNAGAKREGVLFLFFGFGFGFGRTVRLHGKLFFGNPTCMPDPIVRFRLSTGGGEPTPVPGHDRRYRKDVIRAGRWWVPKAGVWLDVTRERMDGWVDTFRRMTANGVRADLTVDHVNIRDAQGAMSTREIDPGSADAKRGVIVDMLRDGDEFFIVTDLADADGETLIRRCPEVSLELEEGVVDGKGNTYGEAVTAVTICQKPVVTGQKPFVKIAASRDGSVERTVLTFFANPPTNTEADPERNTHLSRSPAMFTPAQAATLRQQLKLDAAATDADVAAAVLARVGAGDPVALKTELSTATTELGTVKLSLRDTRAQLDAKSQSVEVDVDVLEDCAGNVNARIGRIVDSCRITPAQGDKLRLSLIGVSDARNKLALSTKFAKAYGLAKPYANEVLDAIEASTPGEMLKLLGEKSKAQVTALSRAVPGGGDGEDKDLAARMIKGANDHAATGVL